MPRANLTYRLILTKTIIFFPLLIIKEIFFLKFEMYQYKSKFEGIFSDFQNINKYSHDKSSY